MSRVLALLLAWGIAAPSLAAEELVVWRLGDGGVESSPGAPRGPLSVGSLQKPFLVRAWAAAHRGEPGPRHVCRGGGACWYRPGHGELGLVQAIAQSCNAYFRELAAALPGPALAQALRDAGFRVEEPLAPAEAIGLDPEGRVTIEPRALLAAYKALLREPWSPGDALRRDVLAGLRGATVEGTASPLQGRRVWAKTGTSSAVDGRPLGSSGWVVTLDDAGQATLALLPHGTGREAARALAARRDGSVANAPTATAVTVQLFSLLTPRAISARNLSPGPVAGAHGFTGPGGTRRLVPGDRLESGLWELEPSPHLKRVVRGSLACRGRRDGTLQLLATLDPREYVSGVIAAELPDGSRALRAELGAAALRFIAAGPRHAGAHVCDSTHCAYFVGRDGPALDDALWREVVAAAARPGPSQWSSHCGGAPLSAHSVWGSGERSVTRCRFHDATSARPWSRFLGDAALARAFGGAVGGLRVVEPGGVWKLEVEQGGDTRAMLYDEAHRLLASALGWGALPSPAASLRRVPGGFRADGVGLGHRVGLCLGEARGSANMAAAWLPPTLP